MRDIWICDQAGRQLENEGYCGLSDDVWNATYPTIMSHPDLEILPGLWEEQWGLEGNATLSSAQLDALSRDLATLEPLFSKTDSSLAGDAAKEFFTCLSALCAKAASRGTPVRFVAD